MGVAESQTRLRNYHTLRKNWAVGDTYVLSIYILPSPLFLSSPLPWSLLHPPGLYFTLKICEPPKKMIPIDYNLVSFWRRKWQPTPVFLPGKSHGWRSLAGYSPWDHKESDTTEWLHISSIILVRGLPPSEGFILYILCRDKRLFPAKGISNRSQWMGERFRGLGCSCSGVSELGSLSSMVPMQIVSQYLLL